MTQNKHLLVLVPLCILLGWLQWSYFGYVKDDTYISLRYARNLAFGHGMVFNYGDRLEGYTNFLWVLLSVPAWWLDVHPVHWVKGLSCLFGQLGIFVTYGLARHFEGGKASIYSLFGPALFATSATVVLWSMAGMEATAMAVLCSGGTLFAMKTASGGTDHPSDRRNAIAAGVLLAAAGLCRPDAHAVVGIACAYGALDAIRSPSRRRAWLIVGGIIGGVLVPYHTWRIIYFGDWLPNTFYVKAAAGPEVYTQGLEFAKSLLEFSFHPIAFGLALLGALGASRRWSRLWALSLALFFILYLIKIGRDEMKWFRLYLPVLPLVFGLASAGIALIGTALEEQLARLPAVHTQPHRIAMALPAAGALALTLFCGQSSIEFLQKKQSWHSNYLHWSERSFQKMGAYVAARSQPGDVAVFQDMGAAPLSAPDQRWVDTIGILDRTVAHELAAVGVNPFMRGVARARPGGRQLIKELDATLRDYFFEQEPDWMAFIAYVPKSQRRKFKRKWKQVRKKKAKEGDLMLTRIRGNGHAHGLSEDPRFKENFKYVRTWRRNDGYWVVLFEHRNR